MDPTRIDRFVYLLGDLPVLFAWGLIARARPDLRRPLWVMSLLTTAGAFLGPVFRLDYFTPRRVWDLGGLGLEDVLFSFASGGVLFALPHLAAGLAPAEPGRRPGWWLLALPLAYTAGFILGIRLFGLSSITAAFAVLTLQILLMAATRRDLTPLVLLGGLLGGAALFAYYVCVLFPLFPWIRRAWWPPGAVSLRLFGVPLEEIVWAALTGGVLGGVYEWVTGRPLKRLS